MPVTKYFRGDQKDLSVFHEQLEVLYTRARRVAVAGRVGRTAIYAAYSWPATPVELCRGDPATGMQTHIDIDVLQPFLRGRLPAGIRSFPHRLDTDAGCYLDGQGGLFFRRATRAVAPGVFKLVTRRFTDGPFAYSIRTLTVGTQVHLQQLMAELEENRNDKYTVAHAEFATFADTIKQTHPGEFLPDEYYEPFRAAP